MKTKEKVKKVVGGAYVATTVVANYAPIIGSSTCHIGTIKAHRMQIVERHIPTTPTSESQIVELRQRCTNVRQIAIRPPSAVLKPPRQ